MSSSARLNPARRGTWCVWAILKIRAGAAVTVYLSMFWTKPVTAGSVAKFQFVALFIFYAEIARSFSRDELFIFIFIFMFFCF